MSRIFQLALLGIALVLFCPLLAVADPDTPNEGSYRLGSISQGEGPTQDLLYVNEHGFWMIGPAEAEGHATYHWFGDPDSRSTDPLVYLGRSVLTDPTTKNTYTGWLYQVPDRRGYAVYWFFSDTPLLTEVNGELVYPLFYSREDVPAQQATFQRYLTSSGTRRM
jgi:hypothetical protein